MRVATSVHAIEHVSQVPKRGNALVFKIPLLAQNINHHDGKFSLEHSMAIQQS